MIAIKTTSSRLVLADADFHKRSLKKSALNTGSKMVLGNEKRGFRGLTTVPLSSKKENSVL